MKTEKIGFNFLCGLYLTVGSLSQYYRCPNGEHNCHLNLVSILVLNAISCFAVNDHCLLAYQLVHICNLLVASVYIDHHMYDTCQTPV